MLGKEENEIITPAIEEAYANRILCFGPYAADGFFGSGQYRHFDGVLAMYHDQGLAPFKLMAGDDAVNFTAGLPVVRTSPDFGTAFDIAGAGKADASGMRTAIYAAVGVLGFAMACVFATFYAVATKAVPENANEVAGLMIMAISAGAVSGPVCGAIVRAWGNPHLGMLFVAACVAYMLWASIQLKMKN